jgi:hypothetical protein
LAWIGDGGGGGLGASVGGEGEGDGVFAVGLEVADLLIESGASPSAGTAGDVAEYHDGAVALRRHRGDDGAVDASIIQDDRKIFGHDFIPS